MCLPPLGVWVNRGEHTSRSRPLKIPRSVQRTAPVEQISVRVPAPKQLLDLVAVGLEMRTPRRGCQKRVQDSQALSAGELPGVRAGRVRQPGLRRLRACGADGYSVDSLVDFEQAFAAAISSGRLTVIDATISRWALPRYSTSPDGVLAGVFAGRFFSCSRSCAASDSSPSVVPPTCSSGVPGGSLCFRYGSVFDQSLSIGIRFPLVGSDHFGCGSGGAGGCVDAG
jgi:hypothetical protein